MELTIKLDVREVQALINLMGETPAKAGFFPLMLKIKAQGDMQLPAEEAPTEEVKPEETPAV